MGGRVHEGIAEANGDEYARTPCSSESSGVSVLVLTQPYLCLVIGWSTASFCMDFDYVPSALILVNRAPSFRIA